MSTPAEGFDASFNKPSGADAAAANRKRAMLYITPPGTGNKGIDQAVWDDYTRHGIEIGFVWEEGTNAVQNGRAQGISDAKAAQAQLNALKGPEHDRPIYFAIDFDIQPGDYAKALEYFQGVNSVLGVERTGAYGHYDILAYLDAQRVIQKKWQTYAWSAGKVYAHIDVLQYSNNHQLGSGTVDFDRMYSSNWGQHGVSKPAPKPQPKPAPKPQPKPKPAPKPVEYTVQAGDSLSSIAAKFKTTWQKIYDANKRTIGSDPNRIQAGQKLTIPQA
jgi:hypothetical protein